MGEDPLLRTLKQTFGYDAFRPLQREIIEDSLAGRDVFALLPTGGGKSLCYQLPALLRPGLTLVISPLVALMKDQVDALRAAGVAATFLNSTLDALESRTRLRALDAGEYRILYVAPERAMTEGFAAGLRRWKPGLLAIDEAHCISEWGHDFRPEYRQLAGLRERWPDLPALALTATATERVREDIVAHLRLRAPAIYAASFNRPNLTYRVVPKRGAADQVLKYVRERAGESGIVYCQSRKTVEQLAAHLQGNGIASRPYHAGLAAEERAAHQEAFLRDEAQVICATIAFGMGINKPNVRFVIHHDLPRNLESYYQETGRAGRDGLPADCLLLFSAGDVVKYQKFLEEKAPEEQRIGAEQLRQMVGFAESGHCRRSTVLSYFGETYPDPDCGGCDNCLAPRETFDGTVPAQQFLSCVFRIKKHSGFSVGLAHVCAVLTGAETERIERWGHRQLSTYGIGKDLGRAEWQEIGRQLLSLGLVAQAAPMNVLELTPEGMAFLKERRAIELLKPISAKAAGGGGARKERAGEIECDEELFGRLRGLRRKMAEERDVPSYVIFSDVSLRQMARRYPDTLERFGQISGVGERKLQEFGSLFIAEIKSYLEVRPRVQFRDDPAPVKTAPASTTGLNATAAETLRRFRSGDSVAEIAAARGFVESTILNHLLQAMEAGEPVDSRQFYTEAEETLMEEAYAEAGGQALKPLKELLGDAISYEQIRMFLAAKRSAAK